MYTSVHLFLYSFNNHRMRMSLIDSAEHAQEINVLFPIYIL